MKPLENDSFDTETSLESLEDIQRALAEAGQAPPLPPPQLMCDATTPTVREVPKPKHGFPDTKSFCPSRRPPLALLYVFDDGCGDGECFRLRREKTIIGRSQGEVLIPHETMMSAQHAEITRDKSPSGAYRWQLRDLESRNGTFVRVTTAVLRSGSEFLLGSSRYRLEVTEIGVPAAADPSAPTENWPGKARAHVFPKLIQLTTKGEGESILLGTSENWIGRDPKSCSVVLNDELVSPRHARIYQDGKGRWCLENNRSLNGTWLRVRKLRLSKNCQFQLGEQQFQLRLL